MLTMKKILALFFIGITYGGAAQGSWTWTNGNQFDTVLQPNIYTGMKINVVVSKGDSIDFGIAVIENTIPSSWDGMVCVYGRCLGYIPDVGDSAEMSTLQNTDTGFVRLTLNPFSTNDSARFSVIVFNRDDPSDADTARWIINKPNVGLETLLSPSLVLYPNPAIERCTIFGEGFENVQVFDQQGKCIMRRVVESLSNLEIDIIDWDRGAYNVCVTKANGRIVNLPLFKQ